MRLRSTHAVAAAAAMLVAVSCDQGRSPVGVEDFAPAFNVTLPAIALGTLTICKEGPAGETYTFEVVATTGNVDVAVGDKFQVGADKCAPIATGDGATVTVEEIDQPAGTKFVDVANYVHLGSQGDPPAVPVLDMTFSPNPSLVNRTSSRNFGGDFGRLLLYRNETLPPPPLDGRMTGGGSVFLGDTRFTHGFELHCNVNDLPNNLEVNWPDNRFHLTALTSVVCTDDPALNPLPRKAGFDTYTATGVGLHNGQPGATIEFVFTDDGEPGTKDHATMTITPAGGSPVTVDGYLTKGNHQAHWVK